MAPKGYGRDGFCKLCAAEPPEAAAALIKAARDGANAKQAQLIADRWGITFNRATWYTHKEHAQTAVQRLEQAAVKVRREGALQLKDLKKHSNIEALEAIRDIGMQNALEKPDDVTVDHALKALQILESRKDKGGDMMNILVNVTIGQPPAMIVEGSARELPSEGESS